MTTRPLLVTTEKNETPNRTVLVKTKITFYIAGHSTSSDTLAYFTLIQTKDNTE